MASENKVKAVVHGSEGEINISGGSINPIMSSAGDSRNEVDVEIENSRANINIAGGDINKRANEVVSQMLPLLLKGIKDNEQKEDVRGIVNEILEQTQKPLEQQNISKIKRLLDGLSGYVGLVVLATTQAEKLQSLFFQLKGLILGG